MVLNVTDRLIRTCSFGEGRERYWGKERQHDKADNNHNVSFQFHHMGQMKDV